MGSGAGRVCSQSGEESGLRGGSGTLCVTGGVGSRQGMRVDSAA